MPASPAPPSQPTGGLKLLQQAKAVEDRVPLGDKAVVRPDRVHREPAQPAPRRWYLMPTRPAQRHRMCPGEHDLGGQGLPVRRLDHEPGHVLQVGVHVTVPAENLADVLDASPAGDRRSELRVRIEQQIKLVEATAFY